MKRLLKNNIDVNIDRPNYLGDKVMEIKNTDFGLAYCYGNVIEINKALLKYPKLYKAVLQHEKEHLKNPESNMDFFVDLKDMFNFKKQLSKEWLIFNLKHPKISLQSLCPIWFDKGFHTNLFLIVIYSIMLITSILAGAML